jgi:spermidine synthase
MPNALLLQDSVIYQEMMSHPALFSHPHPKTVTVIGDEEGGIIQEINKHPNITQVQSITQPIDTWIKSTEPESTDILIVGVDAKPEHFKSLFSILKTDGILVQKAYSPFHVSELKQLQQELSHANFPDIHFLSFPQPHFTSGWRTAIIAKKHGHFRRIREKDIYNKSFTTRYYNFDIHKASLVLPEFMREELEPLHD